MKQSPNTAINKIKFTQVFNGRLWMRFRITFTSPTAVLAHLFGSWRYHMHWQLYVLNVLIIYMFLYNKTNQTLQFPKFTLAWNSRCFGQFLCPSSGVYSLYTRHWYICHIDVKTASNRTILVLLEAIYMTYIPVPSVQWINFWWCREELLETCRVSCRSKFGKLVHLVGFIIKKFVTMQHGHMNVKNKNK
jgi:hypothetical protein